MSKVIPVAFGNIARMKHPSIHEYPKPPKDAILQVLFDSRGVAQKVRLFVSSGYKSRDDLCIEYCLGLVHPPARIGHKLAGDSWRKLTVHKYAVFKRS